MRWFLSVFCYGELIIVGMMGLQAVVLQASV
jgi:hypothetical protein